MVHKELADAIKYVKLKIDKYIDEHGDRELTVLDLREFFSDMQYAIENQIEASEEISNWYP